MTIPSTMDKTDFASWCHPLAALHHPAKALISFQFLNNFFQMSFLSTHLDIRRILLLKRKQTCQVKQNKTIMYCCLIINSIST